MNVFELIKEKLEEVKDQKTRLIQLTDRDFLRYSYELRFLEKIKEIVNQLAEEYNNGWIPCSERLPELRQDCLVTVKYSGFMGMYGTWIKTGHMETENDWWGDCSGGTVIAWQPLPAPYKEGGTE